MRFLRYALPALLAASLIGGYAHAEGDRNAAQAPASQSLEPIPSNKDNDLRLFYADGRIVTGSAALQKMSSDAKLSLWLAGNQFFASDQGQNAYAKFGFIKASKADLAIKEIP